ncbi:MAG TPA: hypothetical protein VI386_34755 [Candidatus Sulfotelmatobacter sp.]
MTPSTPPLDLATQWKWACRLYPVYFEIAREFVIDVEPRPDLESGGEMPEAESAREAVKWVEDLDQRVQVHQLRQFLQTSSLAGQESLATLLHYLLAQPVKNDSVRDKVDFLLVQYFSQFAPSKIGDGEVDLAYVVHALEPVLGEVDLKSPVWLNALDRRLDSARRCRSLDELLHGGVLEQGRKAKSQAGDLYFLPIALCAFTRYGYLMRRVFFRLMHGDLNAILDGLDELEELGVETIDCRRAQFSEQEPILRLRMICQSWKVLFQAEYSSGQPLRMLVELRASVEQALGRGSVDTKNKSFSQDSSAPETAFTPRKAAAASAGAVGAGMSAEQTQTTSKAEFNEPPQDAEEFEVTSSADWGEIDASQAEKGD